MNSKKIAIITALIAIVATLAVLNVSEESEAAETGETISTVVDVKGEYTLEGDLTFTGDGKIVVEKGEILIVDPKDLSLTGTNSAIIELEEGSYLKLTKMYDAFGLEGVEIPEDTTVTLDGTVNITANLDITKGSFNVELNADKGTMIGVDGGSLTFVQSTNLKLEMSLGGGMMEGDDDEGFPSINLAAEFNGEARIDVGNVSATVKGHINVKTDSSVVSGDANFEINVVKTPNNGPDPDYGFDISAKLDLDVNLNLSNGLSKIPTGKIHAIANVDASWSDEDGDEFVMKGLNGVIDIVVDEKILKPEANLKLDSLQSRGNLNIDVKNVYAKVFCEVDMTKLEESDIFDIGSIDITDSDFNELFGTLLGLGQEISFSAGVETAEVFFEGIKVKVTDTQIEGTFGGKGAEIKGTGSAKIDSYTGNKSFLVEKADLDASIDIENETADITVSSEKVVYVNKGLTASLKNAKIQGDMDVFSVSADEVKIGVKNAGNTDIASITGTVDDLEVDVEAFESINIQDITAKLEMKSPSGKSSLEFDNADISITLGGYFTDDGDIQLHSGTMSISTDGSLYLPTCIDVEEDAVLNVSGDVTIDGVDFEGTGSGVLKLTEYCYVKDGDIDNYSDALLSVDLSNSDVKVVLRDYQKLLEKNISTCVDYVISDDGTYADVIPSDGALKINAIVNLKATLDGEEVEVLNDSTLSINAGGAKMLTDGVFLYIADEEGKVDFLPYKGPDATYEFTKVNVEETLNGEHFAPSSPDHYVGIKGTTTIMLNGSEGQIYMETPDGVKFQFNSYTSCELTVAVKKMAEEGHYDITSSSLDITILIPIEEGQTVYHVSTPGLNPEVLDYEIVTIGDKTYASFETDSFSEFYVSDGISSDESSSESGSSDNSMPTVGIVAAVLIVLLLAVVAFRLKSKNSN